MFRPDQLNELIGEVEIPDDAAYETLGGFVMAELGRIPFLGDVVDTEGGVFTVTALDKRRVAELHFVPHRAAARAGSASSASSPDEAAGDGHERLRRPALAGRPAAGQRVLRRGGIRRHVGAPLARSSRWPTPGTSAPSAR